VTSALVLLLVTAGLCALFHSVFVLARRIDNYGIVDVAWSYAFGVLAIAYALVLPGAWERRTLLAVMVVIWSLRLGTHLYRRVMSHHPVEDGRYQRLRIDWADGFEGRMARFFQMQALSVVVLGVPFFVASLNPAPGLHVFEWVGAGLWLLAIAGESLADHQLSAFKRDPSNRGRVCDRGLWRWSRHPNYFFEWLVWVAFFVFALASPWGGIAVISPAVILYLLLRVTGIPLTEEQSVRSKGEAYRRYQRTTSMFLPLPPRPDAG
jgi:steroid 5-alpha reductase family enzyme